MELVQDGRLPRRVQAQHDGLARARERTGPTARRPLLQAQAWVRARICFSPNILSNMFLRKDGALPMATLPVSASEARRVGCASAQLPRWARGGRLAPERSAARAARRGAARCASSGAQRAFRFGTWLGGVTGARLWPQRAPRPPPPAAAAAPARADRARTYGDGGARWRRPAVVGSVPLTQCSPTASPHIHRCWVVPVHGPRQLNFVARLRDTWRVSLVCVEKSRHLHPRGVGDTV